MVKGLRDMQACNDFFLLIKRKYWVIYSVLTFYFISTILCTTYFYLTTKHHLIGELDYQLELVSKGLTPLMGEGVHSQLFEYEDLTEKQKKEMDFKLTSYAKQTDVAYVYTLKKIKNKIVFVASSLSPEEIEQGTYSSVYFDEYTDRDPAVDASFDTGDVQFAEYTDQWGSFRSIFFPYTTIAGEVFVIGVDVRIDVVRKALAESVMYTLVGSLIFLSIGLPIVYLFVRSSLQVYQQRVAAITRDPVTGLPNKYKMLRDIAECDGCFLVLMSIHRFSDVTTVYGPSVGDFMLKQFAIRLSFFSHDSVDSLRSYFVHGNDFAVLVKHSVSEDDENKIAEALITQVSSKAYHVTSSDVVHLTVDVGAVQRNDTQEPHAEELFAMANVALVEAKSSEESAFIYRENDDRLPEVYKKCLENIEILKLALEEDRVKAYFQAIFSCGENKRILHYECLARVVDSNDKVILLPDEFIPIAHRSKLYPDVTKRIVQEAIRFVQKTRNNVSVNISVSDINNEDTVRSISQLLRRSKVAHKIMLELLEDECIFDYKSIVRFIFKMKKMGVRFGIDDIGKNYSNFDRLTRLPVNFIKIDGSVIKYVDEHEDTRDFVKEIVNVAHKKDVSVVAEYCVSEPTMEMAESLGVDCLQGYYLAKPESFEAVCEREEQYLLS